MDPTALRSLYDDEMRRRLVPPPGRRFHDDGVLARIIGPSPDALDHMVCLSRLSEDNADAVVAAEVDRARRAGHGIQWNVYDGDLPPDLVTRLTRAGLHEQARETVLVRASEEASRAATPPPGVEVHRLTREEELADYFSVDEAVWGTRFTAWVKRWLVPALAGATDPVGVFLARDAGMPVGCGWVWLPRGRSFAHLFGGTVLPSHRRRGVYHAIVAARARLAQESGYRWLVTDANHNSAPVLRNIGFEPIGQRIEMVLDAPEVSPSA